jgi:hypothetical protein
LRDGHVSTWSSREATAGPEGLLRIRASVRWIIGLVGAVAELQSSARLRSSAAVKIHSAGFVASVTCGLGRNRPCGEPSTRRFVGLRSDAAESRRKRGVETPAGGGHSWLSSFRPKPSGRGRNVGVEASGKAGIGYMMASATSNRSPDRGPSGSRKGKLATQQARPRAGDLAPRKRRFWDDRQGQ